MVPDAGHLAAALVGAFRLLRFDRTGFQFFDPSIEGFRRSFFAAVVILPLYVPLIVLRMDDAELANPVLRILAIEVIAYVTGWVAFPLVMAYLAQAFDRWAQYPGYIVAYNWGAVPQVLLMAAVALARAAGLFPEALQTGLHFGVMLYLLAVQWFVARRALDVRPGAALSAVAIDFMLSLLIASIASAMLARPAGA